MRPQGKHFAVSVAARDAARDATAHDVSAFAASSRAAAADSDTEIAQEAGLLAEAAVIRGDAALAEDADLAEAAALAEARRDGKTGHRFGVVLKVFGILLIITGIVDVVIYVATSFLLGIATLGGIMLEQYSTVTTVILIVGSVLLAATAAARVVLGIRLIRGKNRGVALACKLLASLQALTIVCQFMLEGLSGSILSSAVSILLLSVLESYADPTLRLERELARRKDELQDKADQEAGTLGRDKTGEGYLRIDFFNIFWIFVVCCVAGLILEIIWHMTVVDPGHYQDRAGLLYGPFSPIYGFGGVLITILLNRLWRSNPLIQFAAAAVIGASFEWAVSFWMEFSFGITAWDYSHYTLPFTGIPDPIAVMCGGRTSTMFLFIWGALGIVWLRWMLPLLLQTINRIPWNWRYTLTAVCAALMLVDCALTVSSFDCWYQRQAGTMASKQQTAIDKFCNEHYGDAFMEHRFQSMSMDPNNATRL